MTATQEQWDRLNAMICATCGHTALRHLLHRGPCSGCWAEAKPICERFEVRAEDRSMV